MRTQLTTSQRMFALIVGFGIVIVGMMLWPTGAVSLRIAAAAAAAEAVAPTATPDPLAGITDAQIERNPFADDVGEYTDGSVASTGAGGGSGAVPPIVVSTFGQMTGPNPHPYARIALGDATSYVTLGSALAGSTVARISFEGVLLQNGSFLPKVSSASNNMPSAAAAGSSDGTGVTTTSVVATPAASPSPNRSGSGTYVPTPAPTPTSDEVVVP